MFDWLDIKITMKMAQCNNEQDFSIFHRPPSEEIVQLSQIHSYSTVQACAIYYLTSISFHQLFIAQKC